MIASLLLVVSPWLTTVYEYRPAPGQFINEVPELAADATPAEVLSAVEEQICGGATPGLISLGAWGGYVVAAFDHPVVNVEGEPDFVVYGNAIVNSAEPGIVSVSVDANGNGLPDDEWYELIGSEENNELTRFDYTITYRRPEGDKEGVAHETLKFVTDAEYIPWNDSLGQTGFIMKISQHLQSYWPEWMDVKELTFRGTLLPPNGVDKSGSGINYSMTTYDWGYADNEPNKTFTGFDIGNAVNSERKPVKLSHIDFIKVQTGINQFRGWLGEASTEVAGAEDLHPDAKESGVDGMSADIENYVVRLVGRQLAVSSPAISRLSIVNSAGNVVKSVEVASGTSFVDLSDLCRGVYLVNYGKGYKFML